MKKNPRIIYPTRFLPRGSRRITNASNERVWVIQGREYHTKSEYFTHREKMRAAAAEKLEEAKSWKNI